MIALALAIVALAPSAVRPPAATLAGHPLAIASYCWRTSCSQPLEASPRAPIVFTRGALAHVELGFVPRTARVRIDGAPIYALRSGRQVTWRATRSGGVTVELTAGAGWVTYVGRIRVR